MLYSGLTTQCKGYNLTTFSVDGNVINSCSFYDNSTVAQIDNISVQGMGITLQNNVVCVMYGKSSSNGITLSLLELHPVIHGVSKQTRTSTQNIDIIKGVV